MQIQTENHNPASLINLAVPGRSQASFAFQLNLQTDQPRQTLQHVNQVSKHPQSTGHPEKNCKLPPPVKK